jgi:hypothetical protein
MFLGDDSSLDNNIFEESDIKRVILYLDLRQESLLDLSHASIIIILNNLLDILNLFLIFIYIISSSEFFFSSGI